MGLTYLPDYPIEEDAYNSFPSNSAVGKYLEDAVEFACLLGRDFSYVRNRATGHGADMTTTEFCIECKNNNELGYMTRAWVLSHVVDRFLVSDPQHLKQRVLIIPRVYENLDRHEHIFEFLDFLKIKIVEIGHQVTRATRMIAAKIIHAVLYSTSDGALDSEPVRACNGQHEIDVSSLEPSATACSLSISIDSSISFPSRSFQTLQEVVELPPA